MYEKINIAEVSPRDGFQIIKQDIPTADKIHYLNQLADCGFAEIEVSSFVHPTAVPQLKDAQDVFREIKRNKNIVYRALIPNLRGLNRAIDVGVDKVKLMLSATDSHSLHNANAKTFDAMRDFEAIFEKALENNIKVGGSIAVSFGCAYEGPVPIERHLKICEEYNRIGINDISLADTTGMGNPYLVKEVISKLKEEFPHFKFSLHLHNTRGMAFANAVAGYEVGIRDFDSSIGGIGGCPYLPLAAGNISTEDLVHGFEEMGISTGVDLDKVIRIARQNEMDYPSYVNSFIMKAGPNKDLSIAPGKQIKKGDL
ncbi:hydroxymethylglutaryl-CoA lyase [Solibacillus sp. FSL W7-1464]|uniref:hydroxymethylglutaryl-CoA lyase n=1 Tax=Solibacillus sp. FSL W7-1464 TaxID=2921706 RepID=UPI0030F8633C